jgi:alpha-ketoglutarate-dependent taurine dioxygenase
MALVADIIFCSANLARWNQLTRWESRPDYPTVLGRDMMMGQHLIDAGVRPMLSARVAFRNRHTRPPQSAGQDMRGQIMSDAASRIPTQSMKIAKVKEHIGAIVTGVDLAHPINGATRKKLYDAVVENVVLVIRGQEHLTPGQLQAAGEMFGELMEDQNRRYLVDGFPLISVLDNRHKDSKGQPAKVGANATWHTDHTNQELPPKFTILYAVAVPDKGGATSVCNSRAAYEALPDDVKRKIVDAKTENTLISSARMKTGNPDVVKAQIEAKKSPTMHPLVRTHPETGSKAVWFHKGKTETVTGMSPEETQDFLQELTDKITQPQFCYAHEYKKGDLLIIDDRASLHKAGFDYDHSQHRRLYRMLVRGDRPY